LDLDELLDLVEKHQPKAKNYSFVSHFYAMEHLVRHYNLEPDPDILTGKSWVISQKSISEAQNYYLSALDYFRKGDPASALQLCLLSLQINPRDFRTNTLAAYIRMEKEEYKEAKLSFQYAIQNVNNSYYKAMGTLFLSRFYSCYSNYEEALRLVEIAIDGCPEIEEAYYLRATLYAQMGDAEATFRAMDEVLQLNSGYYAGLCLDWEFHLIKPSLNNYLKNKVKTIREDSEQLAKQAALNISEAKRKKAEFYDPVEFKTATSRLNLSRHRLNKNNLFSILEAGRLIKDSSNLALKSKTVTTIKSKNAILRLLNIRRKTRKANIWVSGAIGCVGALAGVFFGAGHTWFRGPENSYPIYVYAVVFFIIVFIGVWISNLMYYNMWEGKIFQKIRAQTRDSEVLPDVQVKDVSAGKKQSGS
jgi:tetratricopeptide (TPR) repeat protein